MVQHLMPRSSPEAVFTDVVPKRAQHTLILDEEAVGCRNVGLLCWSLLPQRGEQRRRDAVLAALSAPNLDFLGSLRDAVPALRKCKSAPQVKVSERNFLGFLFSHGGHSTSPEAASSPGYNL